ncbi:MAG: acetaldehyde dehydrogenase (acetylating) [Bacteroidota bacterium]
MNRKIKVAIIGSGNIGTDLMIKVLRHTERLEMDTLVGIDPHSEGLARANRMGVNIVDTGIDGLIASENWKDIDIVFDATSAKAHHYNWAQVQAFPDKYMVDLTPAAIGPFVVPPVNLDNLYTARNLNMVTCGGQATIPIIAAINQVARVKYGEIVASISSKSAGPGTRANIDEFTETTSEGIVSVGGAEKGKAIIILNPAEPPIIMRDTVFALSEGGNPDDIRESIAAMVDQVQSYVPGYQLKQEIQFEEIPADQPVFIEGLGKCHGLKISVFLKVEGAGHYLPSYAGNLDIMTSAALAVGEKLAQQHFEAPISSST